MLVTSPNHVDKLEKVQNQALRIITGGVKTTPILAMQILTNNRPIHYDIEEKGILLYEKLRRLPYQNYWNSYINENRRLKTQVGFIQKILQIKEKYEIPQKAQKLVTPLSPLKFGSINYSLNLTEEINKKNLKPNSNETVNTRNNQH